MTLDDSEHWVVHGDVLNRLKQLKGRLQPVKGKYSNQDAMRDILALIPDQKENLMKSLDECQRQLKMCDKYRAGTDQWTQDLRVIMALWYDGKLENTQIHEHFKKLLEAIE